MADQEPQQRPRGGLRGWEFHGVGASRPSWHFDREAWRLCRDGVEVPIPPRALAVLELLLASAGRLVGKSDLLEAVWRDAHVGEDSLSEAVRLLRQALGDEAQKPRFIQTVHRLGYRLVATVQPLGDPLVEEAPVDLPVEREHAAVSEAAASRPAKPPPAAQLADVASSPVSPRAWALGTLAVLLALAWWWLGSGSTSRRGRVEAAGGPTATGTLVRFELPPPAGYHLLPDEPSLAITPDGHDLVLAMVGNDGVPRLFRRSLAGLEVAPIDGASPGRSPFVSPDGRHVGFLATMNTDLAILPLAGGTAREVSRGELVSTPSWEPDGNIYYSRLPTCGLWRVPEAGGAAAEVTRPQATSGELCHLWPQLLVDRGALLYTAWGGDRSRSRLLWRDLATGRTEVLLDRALQGRLVVGDDGDPAILVHLAGEHLVARRLDLDSRRFVGPEVALAEGVAPARSSLFPQLALTRDRMAVVVPPQPPPRRLLRIATDGSSEVLPLAVDGAVALAATGAGQLVLAMRDADSGDLWRHDLSGSSSASVVSGDSRPDSSGLERLTFGELVLHPVVTPDGSRIVGSATRTGESGLFAVDRDQPGLLSLLVPTAERAYPCAIDETGTEIVFARVAPGESQLDLWVWSQATGESVRLTATPEEEWWCSRSPDGRWLAYESYERGIPRVLVTDYPPAGRQWQVSGPNGGKPTWSRDGRTLYFVLADQDIHEVPFVPGDAASFGRSRLLARTAPILDLAALDDGSLLVLEEPALAGGARPAVQVLLDWRSLLPSVRTSSQ